MCPSETRDIPKKDVDEWIPVTKNDGPDIQKELARLIGYYHGYDNALKEYYQREPESAGSIFRLEHCIPRVVFVLGRLGSGRTSLALKFCEGSGRKWSYLNCIDTPGVYAGYKIYLLK